MLTVQWNAAADECVADYPDGVCKRCANLYCQFNATNGSRSCNSSGFLNRSGTCRWNCYCCGVRVGNTSCNRSGSNCNPPGCAGRFNCADVVDASRCSRAQAAAGDTQWIANDCDEHYTCEYEVAGSDEDGDFRMVCEQP